MLRGHFDQGAARTCNGASQLFYRHPWSPKAHTFAVLFLPPLVGNLFQDNGVAHLHDLMDHATMQALAMGCQLAFFGSFAPSGVFVPRTPLPVQAFLAPLLGPPLLIVLS